MNYVFPFRFLIFLSDNMPVLVRYIYISHTLLLEPLHTANDQHSVVAHLVAARLAAAVGKRGTHSSPNFSGRIVDRT